MTLCASSSHLTPLAFPALPSPCAGLLNTYKSLFMLDSRLADIKTRSDLLDYLRVVSRRARLIQPLSSAYFVEETGQLKVLSGLVLGLVLSDSVFCGRATQSPFRFVTASPHAYSNVYV